MKKKLFALSIVLLFLVTGCLGGNTINEVVEPIKITAEDMETMEKVSDLAFVIDKDSLEVKNYTEKQKAEIARNTAENGYLSTTGTEMTKTFQKYFGKDQTVTFDDINCFMTHSNADEQVLFIFDKNQDKYIYNDKHPGHGGGGNAHYEYKIGFDSVEVKGDTIQYKVKVLFYGQVLCQDIGPCEYGKAYKTYNDAKNDTNILVDIENSKYTTKDPETDFPITDLDSLFKDYKDSLNTYTFTFNKEDSRLVFSSYKKA